MGRENTDATDPFHDGAFPFYDGIPSGMDMVIHFTPTEPEVQGLMDWMSVFSEISFTRLCQRCCPHEDGHL